MLALDKWKKAVIGASFLLIVVSVIVFCKSDEIAYNAFKESFNSTVKETSYDKQNNNVINKAIADITKRKYHTSNKATIHIDDIKTQNQLEVLKASDTFLKVTDPKIDSSDSQRWVKIPGEAYYTVDLDISEFIVDEYKHFVIVRLARPQLKNVAINTSKAEILLYNYEKQLFKTNGSYQDGSDEAKNDLKEARVELYNRFYSDQKFYTAAQDSAEKMVTAMIKAVNPEVEDLQVEVEFIDVG